MKPKYSLIIRWSDEDNLYIAWVPELGTGVKTHGSSYEEAARMGQEVIEMMMDLDNSPHPMPEPWLYNTETEDDSAVGRFLFPEYPAYRSWIKDKQPNHGVKAETR